MPASEAIATRAFIAYVIGASFLLDSMLQWCLFFKYLGASNGLFGNFDVCLVSLWIALLGIVLYRYAKCRTMPVWLRLLIGLTLVEITTFGSAAITNSSAPRIFLITFLIVAAVFGLLSFVGCYMATTDRALFVGFLCLCTFLGLIGCVLVLTFLLAIDWQVSYTQVMLMCAFPALFFNIAYDSRKINDPDQDVICLGDNLRYGLYLYGEYVAVFLAALLLITP